MNDEWSRYSCQMTLPGFGIESQLRLRGAKVLIVGAGGLGCASAQYLTAAGIGRIAIADFDFISISNLHRQILYSHAEIGLLKAVVACKKLSLQNQQVSLIPITEKIGSENVMEILGEYDIIVDGSDNFETKYLLNDACVLAGKPLVYGAIYQYEGQVSVFNVMNEDGLYSPNYRDVYPEVNTLYIPNCSEGGVLPTIAGLVGCIQANEVIKYYIDRSNICKCKILTIDALSLQVRMIKIGEKSKISIHKLQETKRQYLISVEELKNELDKDVCELIDVRNEEERNKFNIGGHHIPLDEIESNIPVFNKPVIFYCESGKRSSEAVRLAKLKFPASDFFSLDGGLNSWKESEKIETGMI